MNEEIGPRIRLAAGALTCLSAVATFVLFLLSADLADLAPRWLALGLVSRKSLIEHIEDDRVELFVTPNWFWTKDRDFSEYLERCYRPPVVFPREPGSGIPRILVFEHLSESRPCVAR